MDSFLVVAFRAGDKEEETKPPARGGLQKDLLRVW
jgi:hypothetical protein